MQFLTVFFALFVALAVASPLVPRDIITELDVVTITEWVTIPGPAPTTKQLNHFRPAAVIAPVVVPTTTLVTTTTPAPAPVVVSTSSTTQAAPPPPPPPPASTVAVAAAEAPAVQAPQASTPQAAPPASSAAAPAASLTGGSDFKSKILDSHNLHRANHSAPALTWDDNLASIAADIASSCVYAHNTGAGGGGYGQNIGAGVAAADIDQMITGQMYNDELPNYPRPFGNNNPDMSKFESPGWGHFSQIVWKSTTSIGCAIQTCASLGNIDSGSGIPPIFMVCNYKPPGNVAGQYSQVGAPLS